MARILIVDDDVPTGLVLATMLEREGHVAHVLEDAEEALRLLRSVRYDLVLVDLSLAGLMGGDFVAVLRRAGERIPAILISGAPHDEIAETAARCGANGWLPKPLDRTTLLEAIDDALVRASQVPPL